MSQETVMVRFGDIGAKSRIVRGKMTEVLRQRVQDRLDYEEINYDTVRKTRSRILVDTVNGEESAEALQNLPGVSSVSPTLRTEADLESIKEAVKEFKVGESFGVDTNRAGTHDFSSHDINREVGAFVQERTGAEVDLDNPETWIEIDIRDDKAFVFTERMEGPDGFPVGSSGEALALVSGGIDSPVAAYEVMTRGVDVTPVYFYNKPIAAEDHLMRFKAVIKELEKFHPSKKWECEIVDMEEVNNELMKVERGRMVLHRIIMFRVAEKIAEERGLNSMVTGEALGQKSSQTGRNLELTTSQVDKPILRPLLTWPKNDIVDRARNIGTYELAEINSACQTLAPGSPATSLSDKDFERLKEKIDLDSLVEKALDSRKTIEV